MVAELIPNKVLNDILEQLPKEVGKLFERHFMDYKEMIKEIRDLDFSINEQTADSAVKAVLGIIVSSLEEDQARKLTEKLPKTLTLDKLLYHEMRIAPLSVGDYVSSISALFRFSQDQARTIVKKVLHTLKEATGDGVLVEIERYLPNDWAEAIEKA